MSIRYKIVDKYAAHFVTCTNVGWVGQSLATFVYLDIIFCISL